MEFFQKKIGGVKGTYNRKPHNMFGYNIDFKCCFGISFNKT